MSKCFNHCLLILLVCVWASCSGSHRIYDSTGSAPGALKVFAQKLLDLHEKGNDGIEATLECFEWKGIEGQTREAILRSLYFDLDTPILLIKIERWTDAQHASYFPETSIPNIDPEWIFHLHFDSNPAHVLSLPLGKTDKGYKFANPIIPPSGAASTTGITP